MSGMGNRPSEPRTALLIVDAPHRAAELFGDYNPSSMLIREWMW
jgi:hypothetical protein